MGEWRNKAGERKKRSNIKTWQRNKNGREIGHFPLLKTIVLAGGHWNLTWFSMIPDKWLQTFLAFGFLKVFWIFISLLPTGWVFGYWIRFFGILVVLQDKLDTVFPDVGFYLLVKK
jgi:hypothetical protein